MNVLEMKCLRIFVGVSRMDRARYEEVRRRAEIEREQASRADQRILRWFAHVERMDEFRMARRVLMAEISGGQVRGRQRLGQGHLHSIHPGWCEGGLRQQSNDCGGCASMSERSERVENPGTYVTE